MSDRDQTTDQTTDRVLPETGLPPSPSADHFARELNGGDPEPELPIVPAGEVDDEPELPTRVTDTSTSGS